MAKGKDGKADKDANEFLRRRFLVWLEYLEMDMAEDGFTRLSDRAIARVFGVHHRLIQQARRGAKWQARNPLLRVWADARMVLEMEEITAAEVEQWDEAIKRGERDIVPVEVARKKALPPKPPTRADLERKRKLDAKLEAVRAEFAAQLFGHRPPAAKPAAADADAMSDPKPQSAAPPPPSAPVVPSPQAPPAAAPAPAPSEVKPVAAPPVQPIQPAQPASPTQPAQQAQPAQSRVGRAIAAPKPKRKRRGLLGKIFGKPAPATRIGTVSRPNRSPESDGETN